MKLVVPSIAYDEAIQAYRQEFIQEGGSMDGSSSLYQCDRTQDWLDEIEQLSHPETVPEDRVPSTQYLYVRPDEGKVVGVIQIRHYLNDYLRDYAGHIGYSVCPSERRQGHATAMLREVLPKCCALGIDRVLVCCTEDNEGSRRTILNNSGNYEKTVYEPNRQEYMERYWIDVSGLCTMNMDGAC